MTEPIRKSTFASLDPKPIDPLLEPIQPASAGAHKVKGVELTCDDCQRQYEVWFSPNKVWNAVMLGEGGMLCVDCFMLRAKAKGILTAWRVEPEFSPAPSPSLAVGAAEWLAKRGSHNPLVYRELKTSYEYDSVASLLEDYSSDLRQQLAEAQQEIQLVKACNESQAAGVKAIWKILDPDGTYEGDLNLHDFLRQQLSSALRERDQAEAEVKTLVETHEKMNGASKAAESTSTKLREAIQAIRGHARHSTGCGIVQHGSLSCTCGFDDALNAYAAALTTPEAGKE